jgi:hypothetical protein
MYASSSVRSALAAADAAGYGLGDEVHMCVGEAMELIGVMATWTQVTYDQLRPGKHLRSTGDWPYPETQILPVREAAEIARRLSERLTKSAEEMEEWNRDLPESPSTPGRVSNDDTPTRSAVEALNALARRKLADGRV